MVGRLGLTYASSFSLYYNLLIKQQEKKVKESMIKLNTV